jgi:hypothetical protein
MARGKKHSPEQIVSLLRQIEVAVANGKTTALASKETLHFGLTLSLRTSGHSQPSSLAISNPRNSTIRRACGQSPLDLFSQCDWPLSRYDRIRKFSEERVPTMALAGSSE